MQHGKQTPDLSHLEARAAASMPPGISHYSEMSGENAVRMTQAIAEVIVPRLMLRHQCHVAKRTQTETWATAVIAPADRQAFEDMILRGDISASRDLVATLRQQGVPVQAIFLDLLTGTARRLGVLWETDVCDFMQVTVGLTRLQQIMRELSQGFERPSELSRGSPHLSAVMVPAAGEQHTFGPLMVAEFFRFAGWDVWSTPPTAQSDVEDLVAGQWFDVVGLSLSGNTLLDQVTSDIRTIRRVSRNRAITVMVGGPVFLEHPEIVNRIGADGMAMDGLQAVALAENLVRDR